jgi:hypothetical protein
MVPSVKGRSAPAETWGRYPGDQFRCIASGIPLQGSKNSSVTGVAEMALKPLIYNES